MFSENTEFIELKKADFPTRKSYLQKRQNLSPTKLYFDGFVGKPKCGDDTSYTHIIF